jgi:polyhydroxyalkanoate synthesis regulator phasin
VTPVPEKKTKEPPDEQSKRFMEEAQRMIDAGELNPTEARASMDKLVRRLSAKNPESGDKTV